MRGMREAGECASELIAGGEPLREVCVVYILSLFCMRFFFFFLFFSCRALNMRHEVADFAECLPVAALPRKCAVRYFSRVYAMSMRRFLSTEYVLFRFWCKATDFFFFDGDIFFFCCGDALMLR